MNDLKLRLEINFENDRSNLITLLEEMENFKHEQLMRPSPSMSYRQRPRLRGEIRSLMRAIHNTTNPPTQPQYERIKSLGEELDQHLTTMRKMEGKIEVINEQKASTPQIILKGNSIRSHF